MAITVDAATVARWTNTISSGGTITSGSFTPPNGSLLVCCINFDQNTAFEGAVSFSVAGGTLTWTSRADSGQQNGRAAIFTAPVVTGASMTCGVTATGQGGSRRTSAKLYIVTGQHASPIGASVAAGSVTNNISPTVTATVAGSGGRLFGVGTDWNALGAPTSSDTEDAADYAGAISVMSAYKAADHAANSGNQSINFDAAGASAADWRYALLEVLAAAGGGGATIYTRRPLDSPIFQSRVIQ